MKKESKSAYELIPASLVFIKIALQLCAPKTPLVGVEGHKSERTQVNKGFLDEEDTEHFTEKCKERVRDNSHPHMPTQAGVSSPNEPTSPSGGSNVDLNFSDSNSTNVSNYELLQIFRKTACCFANFFKKNNYYTIAQNSGVTSTHESPNLWEGRARDFGPWPWEASAMLDFY